MAAYAGAELPVGALLPHSIPANRPKRGCQFPLHSLVLTLVLRLCSWLSRRTTDMPRHTRDDDPDGIAQAWCMASRLSIDRESCHSLAQVPAMVRVQHDHRVLRQLQAVQLVEDLARRRVRPRNLRVHIRSCQRSMSGLGFATTSEHAEDARSECMSGLGFDQDVSWAQP